MANLNLVQPSNAHKILDAKEPQRLRHRADRQQGNNLFCGKTLPLAEAIQLYVSDSSSEENPDFRLITPGDPLGIRVQLAFLGNPDLGDVQVFWP